MLISLGGRHTGNKSNPKPQGSKDSIIRAQGGFKVKGLGSKDLTIWAFRSQIPVRLIFHKTSLFKSLDPGG